jgi:hypothetical protein
MRSATKTCALCDIGRVAGGERNSMRLFREDEVAARPAISVGSEDNWQKIIISAEVNREVRDKLARRAAENDRSISAEIRHALYFAPTTTNEGAHRETARNRTADDELHDPAERA